MKTGDRAEAARAAAGLGYDVRDRDTGEPVDFADPSPRILADGAHFHRGRIVLIESRDRVCAVDIAEAGAAQISDLAAETLAAAGMTRVLDRGSDPVQVMVWAGEDSQAVIGPSALSSGSMITLNWLRPE